MAAPIQPNNKKEAPKATGPKGWQTRDTLTRAQKPFEIAGSFQYDLRTEKEQKSFEIKTALSSLRKNLVKHSITALKNSGTLSMKGLHFVLSLPKKAAKAYNASIHSRMSKD